ncbi:MAG TPA: methyltransferase domain-containing protein [Thermoanaerobaculia bacterium]|nr:methyltransferase domain-containing protein [Thermoanaerobaculia bacterium]
MSPASTSTARRSLEKRLRALQRAYYENPRDTSVPPEYLRTLSEMRRLSGGGRTGTGPRLHLGCGGHRIEGWINVDLAPDGSTDALADCARALPFPDGSIAFIHSEDLIEHLDRESGRRLLGECFRLLRPGGAMRLLTPDLRALVAKVYRGRAGRHLRWCAAELSAEGPCEALNMHLRMNGEHRFVYDEELLRGDLARLGFSVRRTRWNASRHPELRWLDLRDFGLNLFLEATKAG